MLPSPLAEWHTEHARFASLLDLLEEQLASFRKGADPDHRLIRDIVCYLRRYADAFHHRREDAAFARLVEREPGMRRNINRFLQQHRVIATAGEHLLRCVRDGTGDAIVEPAVLEAATATYLTYYREHLRAEESDIMPHAARRLQPEDWAYVAAAVPIVPAVPLRGATARSQAHGLASSGGMNADEAVGRG